MGGAVLRLRVEGGTPSYWEAGAREPGMPGESTPEKVQGQLSVLCLPVSQAVGGGEGAEKGEIFIIL